MKYKVYEKLIPEPDTIFAMSDTQIHILSSVIEEIGKVHSKLLASKDITEGSQRFIAYMEELDDKLVEFTQYRIHEMRIQLKGYMILAFISDFEWINYALKMGPGFSSQTAIVDSISTIENCLWKLYEDYNAEFELDKAKSALEEATRQYEAALLSRKSPRVLSKTDRFDIGSTVKGSLQTGGIWDSYEHKRFLGAPVEWGEAEYEDPTVVSPILPKRKWRRIRSAVTARLIRFGAE